MKNTSTSSSYYFCKQCNYKTYQWFGKCPVCKTWNSVSKYTTINSAHAYRLKDIKIKQLSKYKTQINEFDNIMGGGIVPDSLILIGGAPGVGKSTLMLHIASKLSNLGLVLYVSGEESVLQIKSRATRIEISEQNIFLLSETNIYNIVNIICEMHPMFVIIDSIQTMYCQDFGTSSGTVIQIKEIATQLLQLAKTHNITIFILGHITKDGYLAGPKILEHVVDTVLYFENEKYNTYKILRVYKNRFGPTNEIGFFKMSSFGLSEVLDTSLIYYRDNNTINIAGNIVTVAIEGTRPIILEVQALTVKSEFSIPRRMSTGYDIKRIMILIAVIEKRLNIPINMHNIDIFINIASGIKIKETAIDAAIVSAIISAILEFICPKDIIICGELGLSGEIRPISFITKRLLEAEKLGFKKAIIPIGNLNNITYTGKMAILEAKDISTMLQFIK
ncbi:MAG: DNA repair protein RadA [Endomicrobium sp.]|jgi:DNA repair protein RadA/Sms|nr:DNA repair protein RadA [Endomicrobium sp.]